MYYVIALDIQDMYALYKALSLIMGETAMSTMILPDNLVVQGFTHNAAPAELLSGHSGLHFTNGIYSASPGLIVPTTLGGFEYLKDRVAEDKDAFVVAINSDASMKFIMDKKGVSAQERDAMETQMSRALKIARPLALQNAERPVIVLFYDEETPTALYDSLAKEGLPMATLHKWGYGTSPDAPCIEGAYNFRTVLAFPLPNDIKPLCYDITVRKDQSDVVEVRRLTEERRPGSDEPYLSTSGKVLFPVPAELGHFSEKSATSRLLSPGAPSP